MSKVYQVRGQYPGVGHSPIGGPRRQGKPKSPIRGMTIAALDHVYKHSIHDASSPKRIRQFLRRIEDMRLIGYELPEAVVRRRYPKAFAYVPTATVSAPTDHPALAVPAPSERVAPETPSPSRPGQTAFRSAILALYERCAVSGCTIVTALDAAHIVPFVDERSHILTNGLCLRTDLHRLYDAGLLDMPAGVVVLSPALRGSEYARFEGAELWTPDTNAPDKALLAAHHQFVRALD